MLTISLDIGEIEMTQIVHNGICYDKKGMCDHCEHERPRLLTYDCDIGTYRCIQCLKRYWREYNRSMKEFCDARMEAMGTDRVILYPDEKW
jgi:hypothetical protein